MVLNAKHVCVQDKIFDIINYVLMTIMLLIVAYPLYFIVIASFSDFKYVNNGEVWLFAKGFTIEGYIKLFEYHKIWIGYRNTILYTLVGTSLNVILTLLSGYALSRKDLYGRTIFMYVVTITMLFNGGLIPTYLVIKRLNLIDSFWVMILPSAVSAWNIIVTKTFFQTTIPSELLESAQIDGCSNTRFFIYIALPISTAIIAVITLFYAVSHWNAFFNAFIYLRNNSLFPLQLILREILLENQAAEMMNLVSSDIMMEEDTQSLSDLIKYGIIIVSSLPVMILYPFLQKYFVKGIMIGALKG